MKLPKNFFKPLAAGAPAPLREIPVRLERVIHFVPPHNEKVRARIKDTIEQASNPAAGERTEPVAPPRDSDEWQTWSGRSIEP